MTIKFYLRQSQSVQKEDAQKNVHRAHFSVQISCVIFHECPSSIKRKNCFVIYVLYYYPNITSL
jgi:hypothetical protein